MKLTLWPISSPKIESFKRLSLFWFSFGKNSAILSLKLSIVWLRTVCRWIQQKFSPGIRKLFGRCKEISLRKSSDADGAFSLRNMQK